MRTFYIVVDEYFYNSYQVVLHPFYSKESAIEYKRKLIEDFCDGYDFNIREESDDKTFIEREDDMWDCVSIIEHENDSTLYAVLLTTWVDSCNYEIIYHYDEKAARIDLFERFKSQISLMPASSLNTCEFSIDSGFVTSDGVEDYSGEIIKLDIK